MRVVSLVPSLTETVVALGGAGQLVGRTDYCPPVAGPTGPVPAVGGTKTPDLARVLALRPDLVLLDRDENRRRDAEALREAGVRLLVAAVEDPADVPPLLRELGDRLDLPRGAAEAAALERELDRRPPVAGPAPRALVPAWRDPWIFVARSTYAGGLLARVGLAVVPAGPPRYPRLSLDEAAALRPDRVLLPDEPFPFTRENAAPLLTALDGEGASRGAAVLPVPGRDLFWYGTRTRRALARLGCSLGSR